MDDSRGSRLEEIRRGPNVGTMLQESVADPRIGALTLAEAWSSLVPGLSQIPASNALPGYRLFWTGRGENGFRDFALDPDAHLIIGRHSECDVVLGGDGELSLRHLIVLPARGADGAPALRLLDLQSALPMFVDDDSAQRSLLAEGPFAVRLGRYVLGGFPIGPGSTAAPADLPRSERIDASSSARIAADDHGALASSTSGGPYRGAPSRARSVITMLPRPITMVESVASTSTEDAIGLLGAARDGGRVRLPVRLSDLRAGVLVGRADKCTDRGLKPLLTIRVSRVHAVVIAVEGRTMLYDCASTNGTIVNGRRARSVRLTGDGPVIQLAGHEGVELRWTPLASKPVGRDE